MDIRQGTAAAVVRPFPVDGRTPASLEGSPAAARFCAWTGASGRRHVASVFPVDRAAPGSGLPDFEGFVLIAVAAGTPSRHVVDVTAVEHIGQRRCAVGAGLAAGADEWHVCLLAEDRGARLALAADLRARHGSCAAQVRCA